MKLTTDQVESLYETILYSRYDLERGEYTQSSQTFTYKGLDVFIQSCDEYVPFVIYAFDRVKSIKELKKYLTRFIREQNIESFEQLEEKLLIEFKDYCSEEIDFFVNFDLLVQEN